MAYVTTGLAAGDEVSSTYEGRHLTLLESELTHPTHSSGFVEKGDPVHVGEIVGVALNDAGAATDKVTFDTEGIWALPVTATATDVVVGTQLYVAAGVVSNVNTGKKFGKALSGVTTGNTSTAIVKVHAG